MAHCIDLLNREKSARATRLGSRLGPARLGFGLTRPREGRAAAGHLGTGLFQAKRRHTAQRTKQQQQAAMTVRERIPYYGARGSKGDQQEEKKSRRPECAARTA